MSKNTKSKNNGIRKYNAKTEVKLVYSNEENLPAKKPGDESVMGIK